MKQLKDLNELINMPYAADLADYLYDTFDFHSVVARDSDNERDAFTRNAAAWSIFCYASETTAKQLIQAVNDGVFSGYTVAAESQDGNAVKVWLAGGKLS